MPGHASERQAPAVIRDAIVTESDATAPHSLRFLDALAIFRLAQTGEGFQLVVGVNNFAVRKKNAVGDFRDERASAATGNCVPQRLKPHAFCGRCGTAEAVP